MFDENKFKICCGVGKSQFSLSAFDAALIDAGCANYNLLKLSSILPAGFTPATEIDLPEGSVLPTAYCFYTSNRSSAGRFSKIAAAIAIGIPSDSEKVGVIMEWSGYGDIKYAQSVVTDMVREAMERRGVRVYDIMEDGVESDLGEEMVCVFAGISIW